MIFREVASHMVPNGWHNIIPLTIESGQKKPAVKWAQYRHEDIPIDTLRKWCTPGWWNDRFGKMPLTGMVFGPHRHIVALDIDLTEDSEIALAKQALIDTGISSDFVRIGSAPKFMLFFKGDVRSAKYGGIEVFGSSG